MDNPTNATGSVMPATITMSSREIAELTGKEHRNVMRDTRAMLDEMGEGGVLRFEHTHRNEQNGQEYPIFRLPKRECLILVSGYDLGLRTRIIDRWMELEAIAASRLPAFDGTVTDLSASVRSALGGIVKGIVHKEVAEAVTAICTAVLPSMLASALAQHNLMIRRGKTAGQLLREAGFPPVKGLAGWFGNRLVALGYSIEGDGRSEQGDRTARMFDPDKVGVWLRAGGRVTVEQKVAARRGQGVLRLVPMVREAAPGAVG